MNYKAINKQVIDHLYKKQHKPIGYTFDAVRGKLLFTMDGLTAYYVPFEEFPFNTSINKNFTPTMVLDRIIDNVKMSALESWNLYQYEYEEVTDHGILVALYNEYSKNRIWFNKMHLKNFDKKVQFYSYGGNHPIYLTDESGETFLGIILPVNRKGGNEHDTN